MPIVTGYMNLYHSGFYHRRNKPDGNVNVHGGDLYLSQADAVDAIEPQAGYITTVVVQYESSVDLVPNGRDLVATPIRESRGLLSEGAAQWLVD